MINGLICRLAGGLIYITCLVRLPLVCITSRSFSVYIYIRTGGSNHAFHYDQKRKEGQWWRAVKDKTTAYDADVQSPFQSFVLLFLCVLINTRMKRLNQHQFQLIIRFKLNPEKWFTLLLLFFLVSHSNRQPLHWLNSQAFNRIRCTNIFFIISISKCIHRLFYFHLINIGDENTFHIRFADVHSKEQTNTCNTFSSYNVCQHYLHLSSLPEDSSND